MTLRAADSSSRSDEPNDRGNGREAKMKLAKRKAEQIDIHLRSDGRPHLHSDTRSYWLQGVAKMKKKWGFPVNGLQ